MSTETENLMFSALVTRFAARDLRFDDEDVRCLPVQAFGHLDGIRFYFRFRRDHASLKVGPYDSQLEHAVWCRSEQQRIAFPQKKKNTEDTVTGLVSIPAQKPSASDTRFVPTRATKYASKVDVTGEPYRGDLDALEFISVFTELVLTLQEIPEERQVNASTIEWLTAGDLWPLQPEGDIMSEHDL